MRVINKKKIGTTTSDRRPDTTCVVFSSNIRIPPTGRLRIHCEGHGWEDSPIRIGGDKITYFTPKIYREIGSMGHHHNFLIRVTPQEPRGEEDRNQLRLTMPRGYVNTYTVFLTLRNVHKHITQYTMMFANYII